MVKNLPAMQETKVRSLGGEDPLEKGMAIHSSILAWRIPWTEEPGGPQFLGSQRVGHDLAANITTTTTLLTDCYLENLLHLSLPRTGSSSVNWVCTVPTPWGCLEAYN